LPKTVKQAAIPRSSDQSGFSQEILSMNKQIIVVALAGLFSLGAFAQASAPVSTHAEEPAPAEAASAVKHTHTHKHKQHKHHHASAVAEASAPAADKAPVTKP
jgi:hypothetical protein